MLNLVNVDNSIVSDKTMTMLLTVKTDYWARHHFVSIPEYW